MASDSALTESKLHGCKPLAQSLGHTFVFGASYIGVSLSDLDMALKVCVGLLTSIILLPKAIRSMIVIVVAFRKVIKRKE